MFQQLKLYRDYSCPGHDNRQTRSFEVFGASPTTGAMCSGTYVAVHGDSHERPPLRNDVPRTDLVFNHLIGVPAHAPPERSRFRSEHAPAEAHPLTKQGRSIWPAPYRVSVLLPRDRSENRYYGGIVGCLQRPRPAGPVVDACALLQNFHTARHRQSWWSNVFLAFQRRNWRSCARVRREVQATFLLFSVVARRPSYYGSLSVVCRQNVPFESVSQPWLNLINSIETTNNSSPPGLGSSLLKNPVPLFPTSLTPEASQEALLGSLSCFLALDPTSEPSYLSLAKHLRRRNLHHRFALGVRCGRLMPAACCSNGHPSTLCATDLRQ